MAGDLAGLIFDIFRPENWIQCARRLTPYPDIYGEQLAFNQALAAHNASKKSAQLSASYAKAAPEPPKRRSNNARMSPNLYGDPRAYQQRYNQLLANANKGAKVVSRTSTQTEPKLLARAYPEVVSRTSTPLSATHGRAAQPIGTVVSKTQRLHDTHSLNAPNGIVSRKSTPIGAVKANFLTDAWNKAKRRDAKFCRQAHGADRYRCHRSFIGAK